MFRRMLHRIQDTPVLYKAKHFQIVGFGVFAAFNAMTILSVFLFYLFLNDYPLRTADLWMLPAALLFVWLGARSMHLISLGKKFWTNPIKYLTETCFYLQGGIVGAFIWSILFALTASIPLSVVWDGLALGTVAGQIFGRIGCFNYGCCFGKETNRAIGMSYQNEDTKIMRLHPHLKGKPVHPAQLYKAGMNMAALTFFILLMQFGLFHGMLVLLFFVYHGISRFIFEYFRYDIYIHNKRNWITYRFALLAIAAAGVLALIGPLVDSSFYASTVFEPWFFLSFFPYYIQELQIAGFIFGTGILVFLSYGVHGEKLGTLPFTHKGVNNNEEKSEHYRSGALRDKSRL